jgi:hypothetical protein
MVNQPVGKKIVARVAQPRARSSTNGVKPSYCNFFSARAGAQEVMLNFGFNEANGSAPKASQILHTVILSPATARRVKDALVELFQKRDASRVRLKAQIAPAKKPN